MSSGLPREAHRYKVVPHYRDRKTFFTVESYVDIDTRKDSTPRSFKSAARAEARAAKMNQLLDEASAVKHEYQNDE